MNLTDSCVDTNPGAPAGMSDRCPLYPRKRTSLSTIATSALCQKQTYAVQHKIDKRSPRRCIEMVPIRDPQLAIRQSVWNAVSAFDVATLGSMSWGLRHGSQRSNWAPRAL